MRENWQVADFHATRPTEADQPDRVRLICVPRATKCQSATVFRGQFYLPKFLYLLCKFFKERKELER